MFSKTFELDQLDTFLVKEKCTDEKVSICPRQRWFEGTNTSCLQNQTSLDHVLAKLRKKV